MNDNLPKRKPNRLREFDYSSVGAYFITICTKNRAEILSRIVGGDVLDAPVYSKLLPKGIIAEKHIIQLNEYYECISVDKYVIMPDHIHILLRVFENGASRTSPPTKQHSTLSRFVSTFKRFCNKDYMENIWQDSFYDHVIRNREDYEEHIKYIYENPLKWYYENKQNLIF